MAYCIKIFKNYANENSLNLTHAPKKGHITLKIIIKCPIALVIFSSVTSWWFLSLNRLWLGNFIFQYVYYFLTGFAVAKWVNPTLLFIQACFCGFEDSVGVCACENVGADI